MFACYTFFKLRKRSDKLLIRRFQKFDLYLFFILILSAILNIYNIWNDDTVNAYYTAAVTSMMQSWHNFFFASFDP
ncbi:mannosyltransferase, partial [Bacillus altitudinis]